VQGSGKNPNVKVQITNPGARVEGAEFWEK